ncbi:hypothetical protein PYW08_010595 [Mythimna loreyi]|uniref:Uncharacterized protein n=1 Tax=Mythimna loreyi TaxID=667449 RepID=A0ACC2Q415_9NEOP|nr:hypothetical protein PYW08_010595 [Mythimna loreyi]
MQPTNNNMVKDNEPDIDDEITELENLIKKLQAEIVEMSQTAQRPLPLSYCPFIPGVKEGNCCSNSINFASSEINKEVKAPEFDAGFDRMSKDDGLLDEVKIFAESISNIMNSSNISSDQKDALNEVKWNFSALWDDATNSNKSNLEIAEKTIEDISSKLSKAFDYCIMHSSLETNKTRNTTVESTMEPSIESSSDRAVISRCHNVSEFFAGSNDTDTINDTYSDGKKTISDIKLPGDSTGYDDNSRNINMDVADNTISDAPVIFSIDTPSNLPDNNASMRIDKNIIGSAKIPEESIKGSPKPDTVEALKETILKTSENALPDKTNTPEPSVVASLPTPTDMPITKTQSISRQNDIPKSDSILKCINRKFRKIVGIDSEKSISRDRNNTDNMSIDKNASKEFPRSKSEPKRDDSYLNNPTNKVVVLTQDSFKNITKDFSVPTNANKPKIPEANSMKPTESSNNTKNIAKETIPRFVSDIKTDQPEAGNPFDSATIILPRDSQNKNYVQANLKTTENTFKPINSPNGPQIIHTDNIVDYPAITKKNLEQGPDVSENITGGTGIIMPNLPDSNISSDGQENTVLKAEVVSDQGKKEEEEGEGEEQDDYEETEERDDDDDDDDDNDDDGDDTNTYDVD